MSSEQFQARVDAVRQRVDIARVVSDAGVRLGRGAKPRGKCPFHGSKSDSFVTDPARGTARCYGCAWGPRDAIGFVMDHYGLPFIEALQRLEGGLGLDGLTPAPLRREKDTRSAAPARSVSSAVMARFIWRTSRADPGAVRIYLRGRGLPDSILGGERFADIRFHPAAPIFPWRVVIGGKGPVDFSAPPRGSASAPAMVALIRRPTVEAGAVRFVPVGLHVTYLSPSLEAKMVRRDAGGEAMAARKMLGGAAGGCVILGRYRPDCRLFVGEGLETVLSGMVLAGASAEDCGLAVLSLDNLEGFPKRWRNGALPLFAIEPDPEQPAALAFAHDGAVVGLIDADMAPLRGPADRETGARLGELVVEERCAPPVRRPITSFERSEICATLFVKAWRRAGSRRVDARRPKMGQDCNDALRALEGAVA